MQRVLLLIIDNHILMMVALAHDRLAGEVVIILAVSVKLTLAAEMIEVVGSAHDSERSRCRVQTYLVVRRVFVREHIKCDDVKAGIVVNATFGCRDSISV